MLTPFTNNTQCRHGYFPFDRRRFTNSAGRNTIIWLSNHKIEIDNEYNVKTCQGSCKT